ncbi:MAG: UbiA family prenyltransferase [Phycisphaeraceae bacterium]|nr:UbiA family prenyltransferase [Phycisphaeraceae bacterium]
MRPRLAKTLHVLELTRLPLAFAAISNVWLIYFLGRGLEPDLRRVAYINSWPMPLALLALAAMALGLHIYGVALNDALDARRDRLFSPQRPIAAGRLSPSVGLIAAVLGLLAALPAAVLLGTPTAMLALLAAAGLLFYNAAGKFLPAVGLLDLGLIRAANMAAANPYLSFAWPVWLAMTHTIACSALIHRIQGKRPLLRGTEAWGLCAGWLFCTLPLLGWMITRDGLQTPARGTIWIGPILAAAVCAVITDRLVARAVARRRPRRRVIWTLTRFSVFWLILYDAAWLLAAGMIGPGFLMLLLFAAAWGSGWLIHFLAAMLEPLPGYRPEAVSTHGAEI